ncbi:hypothetical protein ACEQ8H_001308 [Pleosporales sp. CAS-2024a]
MELDQATVKLHRARNVAKQFLRKQEAIDEELKQLQQRMYWLKTLRKLNNGQNNDWLRGIRQNSIMPYCRAWNRQVGEKMQARFPVELRTMVYTYLWDRGTILAFPDLSKVAGGSKRLENARLPHFVNAEFMGLPTARETIRVLYDAMYAIGMSVVVRLPEQLMAAVSKDVFQVGLDPREQLRSLHIRLKLDRLRKPRQMTPPLPINHEQTNYIRETELKAWLKTLLGVKHRKNFDLHITLYQRNIRIAVIEEVLTALTSIRKSIISQGGNVDIGWIYRGEWKDGVNNELDDDWDEGCAWEMNDFFRMEPHIWRAGFLGSMALEEMDGCFEERHIRFHSEPCRHVPDPLFVNLMWDDSENEFTTDGESEDQGRDSDDDSLPEPNELSKGHESDLDDDDEHS